MRNLKKVLALVLVFAMMLSTCVVASAASFPDVEANYQYSEAIDLLASLKILGGYEDGTFKPENNITRAEFAKVVYVIFNGMDDVNAQMYVSDSQFNDVAKNQWFNGHVNWASENAIVGGYGDGTFLPSNNVAVKEAIKMVVTAVTDKSLTYPNGYIQEARALKLLEDVKIDSIDAPATRGQVAQLAYNLLFTASRLCLVDTGTMDFYGNEIYAKEPAIEFVFGLTAEENVSLVATYENAWTAGSANLEEGKVQIAAGARSGSYDYAGDANDLFGQQLKAYFNADNELVALVSVSAVVEETTADKLAGSGTTLAPYGKIMGEYITYTANGVKTKGYGVKEVYTQGANGQYQAYSGAKVTAENGESYILLDAFYAAEFNNNGGKVTLIDNPVNDILDGVVDTVIIDFQGTTAVERYTASSKQIRLTGLGTQSFEKVVGHEAFAAADYSAEADPVYATYTVKAGTNTVYTLAPVTSVEGVLTAVDTNKNTVIVDGKTYAAFGDANATVFDRVVAGQTQINNDLVIGNTLKLFLDADGFVVGYVVTEADAVYDLNIGKVIAAADEADAWGNNAKASLTVVTPDGTEKALTIDTTVNSRVGDDVQCVFGGTTAPTWLKSGNAPADEKEIYFNYTVDDDTSDGDDSQYDIVGNYIHYEVDDTTNEVVRVVALEDISAQVQPSNSTKTWTIEEYSDNLCYKADIGFYTASDAKGETVTGTLGYPATGFVGMYYEENEDGELETAYYTASNIPAFANKGDFTLVWADDELVAMVMHKSPDAVADNKVLGIITGFATVAGESEKNGKPTYRTEITMFVNGETQNYYTEDFLAADLPVTDFDEIELTGLELNQLAFLQLQTDGKVEVNNKVINIDYVVYGDLNFAIAEAVRGSYVTAKAVSAWKNPVIAGWSTDADGKPVYNENGAEGEITLGATSTLRTCNETTYVTINATPADLADGATLATAGLFQETAAANLTAGGSIVKSDAKLNAYNVFAYDVFQAGEAEDSDNDGALKTVFVFDVALDAAVAQ